MESDRNGLEVLSREECLRLLAGSVVGRVVVTDRALPAAFPVNAARPEQRTDQAISTGTRKTGSYAGRP